MMMDVVCFDAAEEKVDSLDGSEGGGAGSIDRNSTQTLNAGLPMHPAGMYSRRT